MENIGGTQVGHVPRDKASLLAPLIDRGSITIEGVMHEGNRKRRHIISPSCATHHFYSDRLQLLIVHVSMSPFATSVLAH